MFPIRKNHKAYRLCRLAEPASTLSVLFCAQVNVSNNFLGPEGGKAIASGIRESSSLTAADLRCNGLDESAERQLRDAVKDRVGFDLRL